MRILFRFSFFLTMVLLAKFNFAQILVNNDITVAQAVNDFLLPPEIEAFNVKVNGMDGDLTTFQVGSFESDGEAMGLESGLALSTVNIEYCDFYQIDEQLEFEISDHINTPDIYDILSNYMGSIATPIFIEFDFVANHNSISFDAVFTSQEYNTFVCSNYNDGLVMLLSGPGINGPYAENAENIALVPGTNDPISVNNINVGRLLGNNQEFIPCTVSGSDGQLCPCNSSYFVPNVNPADTIDPEALLNPDVCSDGYTTPIPIQADVQYGQVYHLVIVLANVSDVVNHPIAYIQPGNFSCTDFDEEITPQCADPLAENYNPGATCYFDCIYLGCTDPEACNYNPMANQDDSSCNTIATHNGYVFYDENENGELDGNFPFTEPTLANWPILLEPMGEIVFTNSDGYFEFHSELGTDMTITLLNNGNIFEPSPASIELEQSTPECSNSFNLSVGLIDSVSSASAYLFSPVLTCHSTYAPSVFVHNNGFDNLSGTLVMEVHPELNPTLESVGTGIAPFSIEDNIIIWDFDLIAPGQVLEFNSAMLPIGEDFLGQTLNISAEIALYNPSDSLVYNNAWEIEPPVFCDYESQGKTAQPVGYEEPHFILEDERIEYSIYFQNTGNSPAQSVTIIDSLDTSKLDISTFEVLFSSHSMLTSLNTENGVVTFEFSPINLPDSTSNEPGSHGYLRFAIDPLDSLIHGDLIENTAHIYFDQNEAILTNTSWHTIFDCGEMAQIEIPEVLCAMNDVTFSATENYVEAYSWWINGELQSTDNEVTFNAMAGPLSVQLIVSNELCTDSLDFLIDVQWPIIGDITLNGDSLEAPDGTGWQWYFNDELIPGATHQNLPFQGDGVYSVVVSNGEYCSNLFQTTITNAGDHASLSGILLFPNPTENQATLVLDNGLWNVKILNIRGQLVSFHEGVRDRLVIHKREWGVGTYFIHATNSNLDNKILKLIIQ